MTKNLIIVITLTLLALIHSAQAKVRGSSTLDGLYSTILDEQRDLIVQLPNSYELNKNRNYPVLYLLDGQRNFQHVVGTLDLLNQSHMADEMIIVAIKNTYRTRDFTPTYDESYNRWGISGGADKFLDFIEQELFPYVNKKYRTNGFDIISGHSLSGLLAIYSLQTRPSLFQAHFAFSPSLWWHEKTIVKSAKTFYADKRPLNNYLYTNMGNEGGHMLTSFQQYKEILKTNAREGFGYHADLIEQEGHNTTALAGHNQAFIQLFKHLSPPQTDIDEGLEAVLQFYKEAAKQYGSALRPSYQTYKKLAYAALKEKEFVKAIQIFETYIDAYPNNSGAYFRLAQAHEMNNELNKAIKMVDKALTLSQIENVENNAFKTYKTHLLALRKESH
ncbi:alpha/beta hydrolase [Thalassotalea euphylliae]|uniref:Alpha/beta hydrolase n=1 Tax=Thalassotalea euphylliae TaxID=1655234 RepID=A0A3E0TSJ7_9GAMM|nr:alpha/beta hydrolase-fold protein [Thalassotalea euphylliae]REL27453.1 alpha/beta hydrolase [Thalassotalea euphylliae]